MSQIQKAYNELNDKEQDQIQVIFVSVDYKHDKPKQVADFASTFSQKFIGLSGDESQINRVTHSFKVQYLIEDDPQSHLGYTVIHSDKVYIVDSAGLVLNSMNKPESQGLLKLIRHYL